MVKFFNELKKKNNLVLLIVLINGLLWGTKGLANRAVYYQDPSSSSKQSSQSSTEVNSSLPQKQNLSNPQAGIEGLAKKSRDAQSQVARLGSIVAVATAARGMMCAMSCPKGCCKQAPLWFAGSAFSSMISSRYNQASRQSHQSALDASSGLSLYSNNPFPHSNGSGKENDDHILKNQETIINKNLEEAREKLDVICRLTKYCLDHKTGQMSLPNGKKVDMNRVSEQDLLAAGFTPSDLQEMNRLLQDSFNEAQSSLAKSSPNDKQLSLSSGTDKSSAPGWGNFLNAGESSGGIVGLEGLDAVDKNSGMGENGKRKRKLAGNSEDGERKTDFSELSVNFNGDPIGVSEENIFTLINRRYNVQAQAKTFLLPSGDH